jgi:predicted regulator of amino acid metabolism with ACT domain
MPRNNCEETERRLIPAATTRDAVEHVILCEAAASVARSFGVDRMTIKRYVKKISTNPEFDSFSSSFATKMMFSKADEEQPAQYLVMAFISCITVSPIN